MVEMDEQKNVKLPRRWSPYYWKKLLPLSRLRILQMEKRHLEKIRPLISEQEIVVDIQWLYDTKSIDEERRKILSDRLERKAECLDVPLPNIPYFKGSQKDEFWERGELTEALYLTPGGAAKTRKEINEEVK